jgi:hypothetical protein
MRLIYAGSEQFIIDVILVAEMLPFDSWNGTVDVEVVVVEVV